MKKLTVTMSLGVLFLTACPPTGVVCKAGTAPCGAGCIDPISDRVNCGLVAPPARRRMIAFKGCTCRAGTALLRRAASSLSTIQKLWPLWSCAGLVCERESARAVMAQARGASPLRRHLHGRIALRRL